MPNIYNCGIIYWRGKCCKTSQKGKKSTTPKQLLRPPGANLGANLRENWRNILHPFSSLLFATLPEPTTAKPFKMNAPWYKRPRCRKQRELGQKKAPPQKDPKMGLKRPWFRWEQQPLSWFSWDLLYAMHINLWFNFRLPAQNWISAALSRSQIYFISLNKYMWVFPIPRFAKATDNWL